MSDSLRRPTTFVFVMIAVLLAAPDAWAARAPVSSHGLVQATAVVAPLGLSPFLALALLGGAQYLGWFALPEGLEGLGHPMIIGSCLLMGLLLQFGRSTKVTKPVAEALGTGESLLGVLAVGLMFMPQMHTAVAQADLTTGIVALVVGVSAVGSLIVTRTAFDVLVWLSPIPFVDAIFQLLKTALTVGLVALAVVAPTAAVVTNIIIVIAAAVAARWAMRAAVYGLTLAWDLSFGRWSRPERLEPDPVNPADFGPLKAFVLSAPGFSRRTEGVLCFEAGRFTFEARRWGRGPKKLTLGEGPELSLVPVLLGIELRRGDTQMLLPPRYINTFDDIRRRSGAVAASAEHRQSTHTGVSIQPR